jgi:hypothetical protein
VRADEPVVDSRAPGVAFGWAAVPADSPEVHLLAPAADSRVRADEPSVDFPAAAAEFLARADEPVVDSRAPAADSREWVVSLDSPEPVRSDARLVDFPAPKAASYWAAVVAAPADSPKVRLLALAADFRVPPALR